jgi:glutamate/tyrosine decarboxylase-like PLP-dependent enzyme
MSDDPGADARDALASAAQLAARHIEERRAARVAGDVDEEALSARLAAYDFEQPRPVAEVAADLFDLLGKNAVRTDHPRYFGLFNPPALVPAIVGDLVTATVNPQLAVWSHAPAAAEIESKLVRLFGRLVWGDARVAGTFTGGGSEANHTALLAALARRYPEWPRRGLPIGGKRPAIYASAESHLAWIKIARISGLGSEAVRLVPAANGLSLTGGAVAAAIAEDEDRDPVLVVATAGTTAHGAIDDLSGIAAAARAHDAHVHVDAAWAGGVLIDPARRHILAGIELADSVTIDPHKWLAVPMGAGLYLARDWTPLSTAFGVSTGYMPSASIDRHDAYIHSIQWSRRFIGGKLFAALAAFGLQGYRSMIERQFALAERLRLGLSKGGWSILNETALPLICFAPADGGDDEVRAIEARIVSSGGAWLSSVRLRGRLALRACITGFETDEADVDALIALLESARADLCSKSCRQ